MKKKIIYFICGSACCLFLWQCNNPQTRPEQIPVQDSLALVLRINKCSRLYSAEYKIHKIITHHDLLKIDSRILSQKVNFNVPASSRKIAIPIDVTLKAYIDFSAIQEENIQRKEDEIFITLPDPQLTVSAVKINHKQVAQTSDFIRSRYSEEEIVQLTRQGVKSVTSQIPMNDFLETARSNAATVLFPLLESMGYRKIHIQFRKGLDPQSLLQKINPKSLEIK